MNTVEWVFSVPVGFVLAEIIVRTYKQNWIVERFKLIQAKIKDFHQASDDDERQRIMLAAGITLLWFSFVLIGLLACIAVIAYAPTILLVPNDNQQTQYFAGVSIAAFCWLLVRRYPPAD